MIKKLFFIVVICVLANPLVSRAVGYTEGYERMPWGTSFDRASGLLDFNLIYKQGDFKGACFSTEAEVGGRYPVNICLFFHKDLLIEFVIFYGDGYHAFPTTATFEFISDRISRSLGEAYIANEEHAGGRIIHLRYLWTTEESTVVLELVWKDDHYYMMLMSSCTHMYMAAFSGDVGELKGCRDDLNGFRFLRKEFNPKELSIVG